MPPRSTKPGVTPTSAHRWLLALPGVETGLSYGLPAYLLKGRFFARLRDDDTVLVLQIASIEERDILIRLDPRAFFFTEHYRNYPAVLIRLAQVPGSLLKEVLVEAHRHGQSKPVRRAQTNRSTRR